MLSFLLILFVIFIVIPIARVLWALYRVRRSTRSFFRQFETAGTTYGHRSSAGSNGQRQERRRHRQRGKKISEDVGEYVNFEDLPGRYGEDFKQEVKYTVEEQVVDVEWEDVSQH